MRLPCLGAQSVRVCSLVFIIEVMIEQASLYCLFFLFLSSFAQSLSQFLPLFHMHYQSSSHIELQDERKEQENLNLERKLVQIWRNLNIFGIEF